MSTPPSPSGTAARTRGRGMPGPGCHPVDAADRDVALDIGSPCLMTIERTTLGRGSSRKPWPPVGRSGCSGSCSVARSDRKPVATPRRRPRWRRRRGVPARACRRRRPPRALRDSGRGRSRTPADRGSRGRTSSRPARRRASARRGRRGSEGCGGIDPENAGVGVRAAYGVAPEHARRLRSLEKANSPLVLGTASERTMLSPTRPCSSLLGAATACSTVGALSSPTPQISPVR